MASFFHAYDLRGRHPEEIDEKEAEKVGKAYGTFTDAEKVLVGRDGRSHGEKITEAFISGIRSTGTKVLDAGMLPTPVVYFGQVNRDLGSSAVVTASHNPPEYTGFKFCLEDALAMSREGGMEEIEEIYEEEKFERAEEEGEVNKVDLIEEYTEAVVDEIGEVDLDVIVDCGNGVTGLMARRLFRALGCSVRVVDEEVDGGFPNHLPDPTDEEAQEHLESEMEDEDLGIILDGDGDRAGFVLPNSVYVSEDEVIAVFSGESLKREEGKVVHDLRASKLVPEKIRESGGEPVETRVGHTFISEKIHEDPDVVFAGELSGHYYFPAFDFPWDDGLFASALMARIAAGEDLSGKVDGYPDYPVSPELRIDCPEEAKEPVVDAVAEKYSDHETSTVDGVKVYFESGWALVRPSNTEEKMSVRCEADTEEDLESILGEAEDTVKQFIQDLS